MKKVVEKAFTIPPITMFIRGNKWNHSYPETKKCICLVRRDKWKQKNKQKKFKNKMNVFYGQK